MLNWAPLLGLLAGSHTKHTTRIATLVPINAEMREAMSYGFANAPLISRDGLYLQDRDGMSVLRGTVGEVGA